MRRLIFNVVAVLIVIAVYITVRGVHPFPEVADDLGKKTLGILVKRGLCGDVNECRKQERAFRGGTPDHAMISIFRASDLDQSTIVEIMQLCVDAYHANGNKVTVELTFYRETRKEKVAWFSGVAPFAHLILKGDE